MTAEEKRMAEARAGAALAQPTTAMSHIAIQDTLDGKAVEWLEHVSDEQYQIKSEELQND